MPVRYTCRLLVVRTESSKFRIRYGYIGDPSAVRVLTLTGPTMVIPPETEMTAEELDRWEFDFAHKVGFSFTFQMTPVDAPLVQATKTIEDEIPKGSVTWRFLEMQNEEGRRTFAIELCNAWREQIPCISLATCWENETPQPHTTAPKKMQIQELGGSESVFRRMTPIGLDALPPNFSVDFFYPPEHLRVLLSRIAALSPERYWISLRTEGYEFDRIPGSEVGAFLDQLNTE